jgi:hypothetical protein
VRVFAWREGAGGWRKGGEYSHYGAMV